MSIDKVLNTALTSTSLPAYPNVYTGSLLEYLTWNYTEIPVVFADSLPHAARYLVQVHYYLPPKADPNPIKQQLRLALTGAGCTWPSITNASDKEGQHYVFECEYADGGGLYGNG